MKIKMLAIAMIAAFMWSCDTATDAANAVKDGAEGAANGAKEMADDAANAVKDAVNNPLKGMSGAFTIDPAASKIVWTGKKVTGQHTGNIAVQGGKFAINDGMIDKGTVTIDMTTIEVTDLKAGDGKEKLEGHLNSGDFFGTDKHATAVFNITGSEMTTDGKVKLMGDLNIKGKSNPSEAIVSLEQSAKGMQAVGTLTFDRTAYDIQYGSGKFFDDLGDKMIYDEVELKFNLTASK